MAQLPEDRGEGGDDLPTQARRQGSPDLAGLGGHAPSLSPAVATRSSSASRQSLAGVARGPAGRRLVAWIGNVSRMPGRYSTRTWPAVCTVRLADSKRKRRP